MAWRVGDLGTIVGDYPVRPEFRGVHGAVVETGFALMGGPLARASGKSKFVETVVFLMFDGPAPDQNIALEPKYLHERFEAPPASGIFPKKKSS